MRYKALIFDLDGTAIPNVPNGLPSDRLVKAIANAKDLKLCAATGRPITNAKPILSKLELTNPCIISAGTQIINPQTDQILWEATLENQDVAAILTLCKPYHYEVLIRNELMGEGAPAAKRIVTNESVNVMYIMQCSEADGQAILKELAKLPNVTAAGVLSWTGEGLDVHVTHREATKEHAIAELLKMLGVSREETIGVGDDNNDVHLFKGVGKKVAMGNATELLKSQADVVCDSVNQDGLAKFIEELIGVTSSF